MRRGLLFFLAITSATGAVASEKGAHPSGRVNLAFGRPYTLAPAPNYPFCSDENDLKELTDGIYGSDPNRIGLWGLKTTVGWRFSTPIITIDLGERQPISGVSFSTAAGDGGVAFLRRIPIFVSDDQVTWHCVGDLVQLSAEKSGHPPSDRMTTWRYVTRRLQTAGRYIAFAAEPQAKFNDDKNYVFCDEIEVYSGKPGSIVEKGREGVTLPGKGREGIQQFLRVGRVVYSTEQRIAKDAATVRQAIEKTELPEKARERLLERLKEAEAQAAKLPLPNLAEFETRIPLNPTHASIFRIAAELMRLQGAAPLVITKEHRYQLPSYLELPAQQSGAAALEMRMLKNETRSDAVNLLNTSDGPLDVSLIVEGIPEATEWLRVSVVPWTDTLQLKPVADALPPLAFTKGRAEVTIPSGINQKIWFSVDSSKLSAGDYKGAIVLQGTGVSERLPIAIHVSSLALPKPRMSLGMWDYTHGGPYYGISDENRQSAIDLMRAHHVNNAWAMGNVLSRPKAEAFNAEDELLEPLDFSAFDTWAERWPDAHQYLIFINAQNQFAGTMIGSPQFKKRLGAWIQQITKHLDSRKIPHQRLVLELVDEPHTDAADEIVVAWFEVIKAVAPGIQIFPNPTWLRPDLAKNQDSIRKPDIISPYIRKYLEGGEPVKRYFNERPPMQRLWFYICAGPVRTFDPTHYYRARAWWVFGEGGDALNIWAFGDAGADFGIGASQNSWNEYDSLVPSFTPAFVSPSHVSNSIHWEAVREGVQDYEYLAMLRDALNQGEGDEKWKKEAREILENGPGRVMGIEPFDLGWREAAPTRIAEPDDIRLKVLHLLDQLKPRS